MKNYHSPKKIQRRLSERLLKWFRLAVISVSALGACATPHPVPPPATPYDYRDRHPIVLSESPYVIDIFPFENRGELDYGSTGRLKRFAGKYREFGRGPITLAMPLGEGKTRIVSEKQRSVVVRALAAEGLADVQFVDYPIADPKLGAPMRLSFEGLKAKVADRCGLWPRDLASGSSIDGWQNETYWNFGCATQNMIATQTTDPRDLVSPRGATPADIEMRMRGIGRIRQGSDPATSWGGKAASISSVGN